MKINYLLAAAALPLLVLGCSEENPRVVTTPNKAAALVGELPFNPLQGRVITSWIDKQNKTMSTLFGNDLAVTYARANSEHNYPAGSVLSLVTWNQQEDPRWFGGNIPAAPKSVEFVVVGTAPDNRPTYSYQEFEGAPLKKVSGQDGVTPNDRASYLLSQRAAVLP
jgi:Cytochrome P460